ncbi:helix-turn-helix domain-containing protein, partial [Bifidobacterium sp. UBA744]
VSGNTVTRLIRQGKIPAIRVGRCWRIPRDDMARWLDAHSTTGGRDGFR